MNVHKAASRIRLRQFLSSAKPSRQLADNWLTVNYLFVRMLQQKTRWSDSFLEILDFY